MSSRGRKERFLFLVPCSRYKLPGGNKINPSTYRYLYFLFPGAREQETSVSGPGFLFSCSHNSLSCSQIREQDKPQYLQVLKWHNYILIPLFPGVGGQQTTEPGNQKRMERIGKFPAGTTPESDEPPLADSWLSISQAGGLLISHEPYGAPSPSKSSAGSSLLS